MAAQSVTRDAGPRIWAFRRPDGRFGIRNRVLVLGINGLALRAAERISRLLTGTVCVATATGRGHLGEDLQLQFDHFVGLGSNPNIAAVLVVGADERTAEQVSGAIARTGKPVDTVTYAEAGEDSLRVLELGARRGAHLIRQASDVRRTECPISGLVVGIECGHSDATSGIAGNPTVGAAADRLIDRGAAILVGETVEWLGAEHLLAQRARRGATAEQVRKAVLLREHMALAAGLSLTGNNPGEENIRGGLSTIEEKALGAISKAGSRPIEGLLRVAEAPPGPGLYLMDGPFFSPESMTGFTAAGAHMILFTTGLGNSVASAIAPTIKVSARSGTCSALREQIDFDASPAWQGDESVADAARRLVDDVVAFAEGRLTWGEIFGEGQESITRLGGSL